MKTYRLIALLLLATPMLMGSTQEQFPKEIETVFSAASEDVGMLEDWEPQYVHLPRSELEALAESSQAQLTCLAQAVYFEARGEPLPGQFAVAEVVLNRVDNPHYPDNICNVVFQNEAWKHRCQFSFACDGRSDRPRHMRAWFTAQMVAAMAVLDAERPIAGPATHYHATYVDPHWAGSLEKTTELGRHIFYREQRY